MRIQTSATTPSTDSGPTMTPSSAPRPLLRRQSIGRGAHRLRLVPSASITPTSSARDQHQAEAFRSPMRKKISRWRRIYLEQDASSDQWQVNASPMQGQQQMQVRRVGKAAGRISETTRAEAVVDITSARSLKRSGPKHANESNLPRASIDTGLCRLCGRPAIGTRSPAPRSHLAPC